MKSADNIKNALAAIAGIAVTYWVLLLAGTLIVPIAGNLFYSGIQFEIVSCGLLVFDVMLLVGCVLLGFLATREFSRTFEERRAPKWYCIGVLVLCVFQFILNLKDGYLLNLMFPRKSVCAPVLMGITAAVLLRKYIKQSR